MERARTELLRSLGFDKPAVTNNNGILVVASAQIDYKRSAVLDDALVVTAQIQKVSQVSVVFEQAVLRGDTTLCTATIKVACVSKQAMKPMAMPDDLHQKIRDWHQGLSH